MIVSVLQILLPSGAEVHIKHSSIGEFFEVDIYPNNADKDKTQGLCGSYDGNPSNDPNDNSYPP